MSEIDETTALGRGEPDDWVRLSAHPRARRSIARSKALGGLVGFLLGYWLGSRAGLPAWDTGVRALVGGITGYVLIWVVAVQLWRQIALAEFRHAETRRRVRVAEYNARMQQLREDREEAMRAAHQALS
jgi:type VI protein secretion system component VasK